jgi:hypothetical protein
MAPKPKTRAWTDEEVQAEIAAAVKIVHDDRRRATYAQLHEEFGGQARDPSDPKPPPKEPGNDPQDKPRRGLWWGPSDDDDDSE